MAVVSEGIGAAVARDAVDFFCKVEAHTKKKLDESGKVDEKDVSQVLIFRAGFSISGSFLGVKKLGEYFDYAGEQFRRLAYKIKEIAASIFSEIQEYYARPYVGSFSREEGWDPLEAILQDRSVSLDWVELFEAVKRGKKRAEEENSKQFLRDVFRSDYFLGHIDCTERRVGKKERAVPQEVSDEGVYSISTMNRRWSAFLMKSCEGSIIDKKKSKASQEEVELLRYELQDLATQRLLVLAPQLFEKMVKSYEAAGFYVRNGEAPLEFSLKEKGGALLLQGVKIFPIVHQKRLETVVGYDALTVQVMVDLKKYQGKEPLTKQKARALFGKVIQTGFCRSKASVERSL